MKAATGRRCAAWSGLIPAVLFPLLAQAGPIASDQGRLIKIGVLAHRGTEEALRMWKPTAAYLTAQLPGTTFSIVPLDFQQIGPAVARGAVDFVLANSSISVELEARYDIAFVATLKNKGPRGAHTSFGGVIFCRADRNDIRELADLKGKAFAAVDETSFGGWQVGWRELKAAGIDPFRHFSSLAFLHTHDAVVTAVRDGHADAGTVRTDTLERMADVGAIRSADFRILNHRQQSDFPFLLSTRLYPEWPFARIRTTADTLAKRVAVALLSMPPESPAAEAAFIEGWTTPLIYQPVHDLLKELRIGHYRNYGKIPLRAAIRLYWYWVAAAAFALLVMAVITLHVVRLNRWLHQSRRELEEARRGLELQVQERTMVLEKRNEDLRIEIGQRKQAELDSRQAREEWELTFHSIPDLIAIIDTGYRIIRVNASLAAKLGQPAEALVGELCFTHLCGVEEPPPHCPHRLSMVDGVEHTLELRLEHLGGDYVLTASPLKDPEGKLIGVVHVCHDITARKRAEHELQQAESRFRSLVEQSLVGISIIRDGRFLYVNPKLVEIFGYTAQEEIVAQHVVEDLIAPESRELVAENIRRRLADEVPAIHYVFKGLRKDGAFIDVEAYGTRMIMDGRPAVIGTILDITDKLRAEREREAARLFLQAVVDGVHEAIMVIAPDHKVVLMNHMARDVAEYNTFCYHISHNRDEPCADEHPCPLQTVLETKKPVTVTHTHRHRNGTAFQVEILASPIFDGDGTVIYVVEACRDITEKLSVEEMQRKMQDKLFQEQKEQSIATLAGGIAHDFNNILMGIIGNAELLTLLYPASAKQQDQISTIIDLSKRMAHLTQQLLAYAKQGAYERMGLSLNSAVHEAIALTHKGPASAVAVALDLPEDLWPVLADTGQVNQTLINLLTNAFESMPGGGQLAVRTENVPAKMAWECDLGHRHREGDYVHLQISDTGHGIPAEIRSRIFEPFFTTKFMGRGLGLAAALGIIQNHGGCIAVDSAQGKGTTFDIYLPRYAAAPLTRATPPARAPAGRILVADDEPTVLALLTALLAELGCTALQAADGAQARDLFQREHDTISLAIVDIQMEGMDGKQLARDLKTIKPDLKVLISSGYDAQTALQGLDPADFDGFIPKPYGLSDLREKLSKILAL